MSKPKMQWCFNCGEELGVYAAYHGDLQTCGSAECAREERRTYEAEREEAHQRLDDELGYGRF